jgi:hypothetical protein
MYGKSNKHEVKQSKKVLYTITPQIYERNEI